eukprot:631638_1
MYSVVNHNKESYINTSPSLHSIAWWLKYIVFIWHRSKKKSDWRLKWRKETSKGYKKRKRCNKRVRGMSDETTQEAQRTDASNEGKAKDDIVLRLNTSATSDKTSASDEDSIAEKTAVQRTAQRAQTKKTR